MPPSADSLKKCSGLSLNRRKHPQEISRGNAPKKRRGPPLRALPNVFTRNSNHNEYTSAGGFFGSVPTLRASQRLPVGCGTSARNAEETKIFESPRFSTKENFRQQDQTNASGHRRAP